MDAKQAYNACVRILVRDITSPADTCLQLAAPPSTVGACRLDGRYDDLCVLRLRLDTVRESREDPAHDLRDIDPH